METNEEQTAINRVPEVVVRPLGRVLFMLESLSVSVKWLYQ